MRLVGGFIRCKCCDEMTGWKEIKMSRKCLFVVENKCEEEPVTISSSFPVHI